MAYEARLARRAVLRGGLAGLAALMGCSNEESAGPIGPEDAGTPPDLGGGEFPLVSRTRPKLVSNISALGDLGPADANSVRLPPGFTSRVLATSGEPAIAGKPFTWHSAPDGGATFPTPDGGWIYVSNSEVPLAGGVGAMRFDAQGNFVDAYSILDKTNVNCAGGPTPWGTWLSCEEIPRGRVHECDPTGVLPAIVRPALGVFKHEAVAVDPIHHHVYLTEDEPNGRFYRFVPNGLNAHGFAHLGTGTLEAMQLNADGTVVWHPLPDPLFTGSVPTRLQVAASTSFDGGEGIWWHEGIVYFTTKGDNSVHAYDTNTQRHRKIYDAATAANPVLFGVDNITVTAGADVLVAEDGDNMQIVAILPDGSQKVVVEMAGFEGKNSELAGLAFDPSGTRLYFSVQRGPGRTIEVTGPWHLPAP